MNRPYFLAALTMGTHHPFAVPDDHHDVRALRALPDRYLAALRYSDLELERLFTTLTFMSSGHVPDVILDMLERMEGRPPSKPQEMPQPG